MAEFWQKSGRLFRSNSLKIKAKKQNEKEVGRFVVKDKYETIIMDHEKMCEHDLCSLTEYLNEHSEFLINRFSHCLSKRFWENAKRVLNKGNYSPFVYFDYLSNKYKFVEGMNSEELSIIQDGHVLKFEGDEVIISPLLYQKLFIENTDDSFAVHVTAKKLDEHLKQVLFTDVDLNRNIFTM